MVYRHDLQKSDKVGLSEMKPTDARLGVAMGFAARNPSLTDPSFVIPRRAIARLWMRTVGDSRPEAQARNPYSLRGLWIPGSRRSAPKDAQLRIGECRLPF
jgi:hypothetical protein